MPTTAQGGFGLDLKLNGTTIVQVQEVPFPRFMKFIAEATGHDSDGGYYEAVATGKRRIETMQATLFWDSSAATHAAVLAAFDSDAPVAMSIEDPDGDEVIAFKAHIEAIGRISQQQDAYKATVDIHPTGTATIS
jgi:hypothetical protein